jgi:hypothetical protein
VMRKVDGGDFSDVEKVTTLLNMVIMVDMVDVMLLWMWNGRSSCIQGIWRQFSWDMNDEKYVCCINEHHASIH